METYVKNVGPQIGWPLAIAADPLNHHQLSDLVDLFVILLTWRFFKITDHADSVLQSIYFFKINKSNNLNSESDHPQLSSHWMRKPPGPFWGTCIKDPSTTFFIHSFAKWYVLFYLATLNSRKMSTKLNIITNLFTMVAFSLSFTISRKPVTDQIPKLHSWTHQNSC